jgi:hypothetical protein
MNGSGNSQNRRVPHVGMSALVAELLKQRPLAMPPFRRPDPVVQFLERLWARARAKVDMHAREFMA